MLIRSPPMFDKGLEFEPLAAAYIAPIWSSGSFDTKKSLLVRCSPHIKSFRDNQRAGASRGSGIGSTAGGVARPRGFSRTVVSTRRGPVAAFQRVCIAGGGPVMRWTVLASIKLQQCQFEASIISREAVLTDRRTCWRQVSYAAPGARWPSLDSDAGRLLSGRFSQHLRR